MAIGGVELHQVRDFCLQLYNLAPVGYIAHDAGGAILEGNAAAARMLGVRGEDLKRHRLDAFTSPEDQPVLARHLARLVAVGARESRTIRMIRAGGERFVATIESAAIESAAMDCTGRGATFLSTLIDVSEQTHERELLQEREATLEAVLSATRGAMVGVDARGAVRMFNAGAERLFGHCEDDMLGRSVDLLFDAKTPPITTWANQVNDRARMRGVRRDGTFFESELRVHQVAGASYSVLSFADVSPTREATETRRSAARLEQSGRMASSIAHDANNLLMRVASAASRIADVAADPIEVRARATALGRTALAGASIVRRLSRLMGAIEREPVTLTLDCALDAAATALGPMLADGITLALTLDAPGAEVTLHSGRLEQLVFNLVVNAQQAMPEGGTITISSSTTAGRARIAVSDEGIGMDAPTRARLFRERFTTKRDGTGVGMATVRSIVEQAGGSIEVESAPGRGARFTIELPATQPIVRPRTAGPAATLLGPVDASATSVLLVEDDPLNRRMLGELLRRRGYEVELAASVTEAVERGPADVVVADAHLPDGTARDVADAFEPSSTPMIVLSGLGPGDDVSVARALARPHTAFLQKPCGVDEIAAQIERLRSEPREGCAYAPGPV